MKKKSTKIKEPKGNPILPAQTSPLVVEMYDPHPMRFDWEPLTGKLTLRKRIDAGLRRVALANAGGKMPSDGNVTEALLAKAVKELADLRREVRRLNRRKAKR